eukprot:2020957-Prorocentrum_lima.AAC.1
MNHSETEAMASFGGGVKVLLRELFAGRLTVVDEAPLALEGATLPEAKPEPIQDTPPAALPPKSPCRQGTGSSSGRKRRLGAVVITPKAKQARCG